MNAERNSEPDERESTTVVSPGRTTTGSERGVLAGVHRISSIVLGLGLCTFGVLGFLDQLSFFATTGQPILGLSTNGLLSTISVVVGAVLIVAGVRGGRLASTVSVTVGVLFLLSGVANVLVLNGPYNILAFRMPNVVFSLIVGLILLVLGAYGRFTGRLPEDSPYRRDQTGGAVDAEHSVDEDQQQPVDPADVRAARELADAERAVAAGGGNAEQRRVLRLVGNRRDQAGRRALWRRHTE